MNKYFFKYLEKQAMIGPIINTAFAGMTALGTVSDIKTNKAKMKLADPKAPTSTDQDYSHQFSNPKTPGRSLFG